MRKFCLVVLVLFASIAQAQKTYYVSNDGSNQDNDGLSENTPFETIAHALSQFDSSESGTVYLTEGIYHEEVVVDAKNNIQFKPVDNANVVINGTIDIASNFEKVSNHIYRTDQSGLRKPKFNVSQGRTRTEGRNTNIKGISLVEQTGRRCADKLVWLE